MIASSTERLICQVSEKTQQTHCHSILLLPSISYNDVGDATGRVITQIDVSTHNKLLHTFVVYIRDMNFFSDHLL